MLYEVITCGDKGIDFLLGKAKVSVRYNEAPKPAVEARITSYNVCYTKLLRLGYLVVLANKMRKA